MYTTIESLEHFQSEKASNEMALFYFSHDECNVCRVLKPKVDELVSEKFPNVKMYYVNTKQTPEVSGQFSIFSVPTILVFIDGRENIRKSRNIGLAELEDALAKPYHMIFE